MTRRVVPALAGVLAAGFAAGACAWALLAREEPLAPWAWPLLWAAAAGSIVAWMVAPGEHSLYRAASAISVTAIAARPVAVVIRVLDGQIAPARGFAGPYHERHR